MKYIIAENRLNEFIFNYLDSWLSSKHTYDYDKFIIIENFPEQEDISLSILMEYDNSDGRLWFENDFRKNLMNLFNKSDEETNHLVKEWFESKFDVEVKKI